MELLAHRGEDEKCWVQKLLSWPGLCGHWVHAGLWVFTSARILGHKVSFLKSGYRMEHLSLSPVVQCGLALNAQEGPGRLTYK